MNGQKRKRSLFALTVGNIVLFLGLMILYMLSNYQYQRMMIEKSVQDVDHMNQSTIDIVTSFFEQQQNRVNDIKQYTEHYHMTARAALEYIYRSCSDSNSSYQLMTKEGRGYEARKDRLGNYIPVDYTKYSYEELRRIMLHCSNSGSISLLSEFKNDVNGENSIAIWAKLNLLDENGEEKEYSLLCLTSVDTLLGKIDRKEEYDDMKLVFVDNAGDLLFQWQVEIEVSNLFTHISVYNDLTESETEELVRNFEEGNRQTLFYKDSKGRDSVFTFSRASTSNWYCVTCLPIASFNAHKVTDVLSVVGVIVIIILLCINVSWNRNMDKKMTECVQEVVSVTNAKKDFLSHISYDIRTPMNGIIGTTQMAIRSLDDKEKASEYLLKTERSSKHLLAILNDLLDMSRAENGKLMVHETKFSLAEVLSPLADQYSVRTGDKEQFFDVVLHQKMDELYIGDSLKLSQILNHLLSNAVKFTPKGGEIRLEVSLENRDEDKQWISFQIIDTGCGVAEENRDRIFEMFEKENHGDVIQNEGTGLGLSIVKRFTTMMGGMITLKSGVGEGSSFRVLLPFGIVDDVEEEQVSYHGKKAVILVSNIVTEYYLKDVLYSLDVDAEGAKTVDAANAMIYAGDFDFCITDTRSLEEGIAVDVIPILLLENNTIQVYEMVKAFKSVSILSVPAFRSEVIRAIDRLENHGDEDGDGQYSRLRNRSILLVEDDDLSREIMLDLLEEAGAQVEIAVDGQDAVEIYAKSMPNHFELILMDIQMPRMDGMQATREIRSLDREDAKFIPIFAMSANTFAEDVDSCIDAGMNDHIAKPVDLDKLYEKLDQIFQRERRLYS